MNFVPVVISGMGNFLSPQRTSCITGIRSRLCRLPEPAPNCRRDDVTQKTPIQSASSEAQDLCNRAARLRAHAIQMVHRSKASHLGSCLSIADLMACLYWNSLSVDPARPEWAERDRFLLSKGHGAAILYATLAERGFFPVAELDSYCQNGSRLTGHATSGVPGVELSSGSLGHALPGGLRHGIGGKARGAPFPDLCAAERRRAG